jgi:hypothetical protein
MALNFPSSPTNGQVYDNWIYSSAKGAWEAKPLDSAKTITADVAPANPDDGDQWFNTNDGTLYIYVVDVDGGQWVESQAPITANGYYSPNYIINGGFDIWQRGTSSAVSAGEGMVFGPDRWRIYNYVGNSASITQQSFPVGTLLGSDEPQFFMRATSSNTRVFLSQTIEDVRRTAGKAVTLSFWAKSASAQTITASIGQIFGSGGSANNDGPAIPISVTTSWARYSATFNMASVSGKTIGANSHNDVILRAAINNALDVWGVQVEEGTVATTFRRNGNSIAEELAACQRYYYRVGGQDLFATIGFGTAHASNQATIAINNPVFMRALPTAIESSALALWDGVSSFATTALVLRSGHQTFNTTTLLVTVAANPLPQFRPYYLFTNNNASAFFGVSAEL